MVEHYLDDSVVHAFWDNTYPARIEILARNQLGRRAASTVRPPRTILITVRDLGETPSSKAAWRVGERPITAQAKS